MLRLVAWILVGTLAAACGTPPPTGREPPVGIEYRELTLDLYEPSTDVKHPTLVIVIHGCCGDKRDMAEISRSLADSGATVANVDVRPLGDGGGWPETYLDVVCAYSWGRDHVGATDSIVAILGWGDGAMVATAVALGWDDISPLARDCAVATSKTGPELVVTVSGHFGWIGEIPESLVTAATVDWFGAEPSDDAAAWAAGNPGWWLDNVPARPDLGFVLIGGPEDRATIDFASQLGSRGYVADLRVIGSGRNADLIHPRGEAGTAALAEIVGGLDLGA